jgi:hypothetical protein
LIGFRGALSTDKPFIVNPSSPRLYSLFALASVLILAVDAAGQGEGFRAEGPTAPFPASAAPSPIAASVARLRAETKRRPSAAGYRRLAEVSLSVKQYQDAAEAFGKEAGLRRKMGDIQGARIVQNRANQWNSQIQVYREASIADEPRRGGPYEPASGCYFGAFITGDDRFPNNFNGFNKATGKQHSVFFDYCHFGQKFPTRWAQMVKAQGGAIQIAFEPNRGLDAVQDDPYLQQFARDAAATKMPVFLRYAAEMNGNWTNYGGEARAEQYIEKWRLVYGVMRRLAPNVAMVWAPNSVPMDNYALFYPGDEYVDWVGINFYQVHHHNNDVRRPAHREDPADQLNVIYSRYASRKPIMICEFAATHYCRACGKSLADYCGDKMRMLYTALPRRYPRVRAIHWFDLNTMTHRVNAGRDINNYSLTDHPDVLDTYRSVISSPFYLSEVQLGDTQSTGVRYAPIASGQTLSGTVDLSAWVHTYHDRPVVGYRLDGKDALAVRLRPYEVRWDTTQVSNGPHVLEALVFVDDRVTVSKRQTVRVAN